MNPRRGSATKFMRPEALAHRFASLAWLLALPAAAADGTPGAVPDEALFFGELPIVFSVSRLAQPLGDAPGSATVIDAEAIRTSGARDLADLLRTVPGFLAAQSPGGAPVAVYHGLTDENPRGLQILVDGRSQYSPLFYGGISWNLLDVALDDIERIEVIRGSNSAAYGSNAFLGVVNIITRSPALSQGAAVRVSQGGDGVADRYARLGLRLGEAQVRLSAESARDDGVMNFNDGRRNARFNVRIDLPLGLFNELQFQAGQVDLALGAGQPGNTRDAPRTIDARREYLSGAWTRGAADGGGISLRYTRSRETYSDVFTASDPALDRLAGNLGLPTPYTVLVDQQIGTSRDELEFQQTVVPADQIRLIWGAGARQDRVQGSQFYSSPDTLRQTVSRLFGNLEWRPAPWVVNVGATLENDSLSRTSLAPRLSANLHLTPEQTLRAGVSQAHRIPTLTETQARTAYGTFDTALIGLPAGVVPVEITRKASGHLAPERIDVLEVGYLGDFRRLGLFADLRLFHERVHNRIVPVALPLAAPDCELLGLLRGRCGTANDFINGQDLEISGLEYQLRWRPATGREFTLNQTFIDIAARALPSLSSRDGVTAAAADRHMEHSAPRVASMLRWSERLAFGLEASVTHFRYSPFQWTIDSAVGPLRRTDVRLAYPLRVGAKRGEIGLVMQGIGGRRAEYRERALPPAALDPTYLRPRSWLSLSLEI